MTEFVLKGHMCWVFPLLIVIATVSVINFWVKPTKEYFDNIERGEKPGESQKKIKEEPGKPKESMEEFSNNEGMTSPLKVYKGPIRGYNCGDYSEFQFSSFVPPCLRSGCQSEYIYPSTCPGDYIFPGKIAYKGEQPLSPYFLQHEADVMNKQYDNELGKQSIEKIDPVDADYLDRPNYMYHRGSGKLGYGNSVISKKW